METSAFSVSALTRRRPLTPAQSRSSMGSFNTTGEAGSTTGGESNNNQLKRTLNLVDLIFYGVGCSVGAGIYSLVGIGAKLAGPSIAISFLLCGLACCFTSLAYAEFAARVPLAGSAYVFAYVSFGELVGWLVGWNLTLGYAVSAAVVARSWAEYLVGFVEGFISDADAGSSLSSWLTKFPIPALGEDYTCCPLSMVIIALCTVILVCGVKESTRFNTVMTLLNLSILTFVFIAGIGSGTVHSDNLQPVFAHGVSGMARGAGLVFFAYLGFDMVSCLAEEVKDPERNMPIGIVGSLMISMGIYVAISSVVVGMVPVHILGEDIPIINALLANACCTHLDQLPLDASETCLVYNPCSPVIYPLLYYGSRLVSFGAIFGLTTATFACLMGQPRIFYSMALDGLLFKVYARVHPKTGVPTIGTILTGVFTAIIACLIDLESLANAISLGTLQVFTFVNAGVIILRMQPTSDDANSTDSCGSPLHFYKTESSPLVTDKEAAKVARNLGLVKKKSISIRQESIRAQLNIKTVYDNGTKPVWFVIIFTVCAIMASAALTREWRTGFILTFLSIMLISAFLLFNLPKSPSLDTFSCPCVPAVPLLGIICNSYMMGSMDASTWYIILIWLLIGLVFYFSYGIHHSELRVVNKQRQQRHQEEQKAKFHSIDYEHATRPLSSSSPSLAPSSRTNYDSVSIIPLE